MGSASQLTVYEVYELTFKSGVELCNEVGRQNQDTLVVLQLAEEDGHDGVPDEIGGAASLQEHIGFVQQEHRIPHLRKFQHASEPAIDVFGVCAKLSRGHGVQRTVC